tara:strand:+ start:1317 stop:2198 length:882 start_codon:yes stop_codon:yes gene_type:complete
MICPYCSSIKVGKEGTRKTKKENYQRFSCQKCGKWYQVPFSQAELNKNGIVEPGSLLSFKFDGPIKVHGATDVHHGAAEHSWSHFDEFIEEVDADPQARWFLNGDNIELIPPNYKIPQRGQSMEPDEQHISFRKRIEKIADKLLFIRGGNHDFIRSVNILGFDVSMLLADDLKVPYFKMPGYTRIDINDKSWYLVSGHGKSGGKNGDLELDKMAAVYSQGDVFFLGHNHQLYAKPIDSLRVEGSEEKLHRRWYCRGGSFLNYAEYARYSFYPMIRTGWVTMEFGPKVIKAWAN